MEKVKFKMNLKLAISFLIAKIIYTFSFYLRFGSGNTYPGFIIRKIFPNILNTENFKFKKSLIFVTGTNGKTTTSKIISNVLKDNSYKVLHNTSGANLMNGIVSTFVLSSNVFGKFDYDFGVIEVDELELPNLINYLTPNYIVFLNLSRDQLDRSGETDIIFSKWLNASKNLKNTIGVFEASNEKFNDLINIFGSNKLLFSANNSLLKKSNLVGEFNAKNLGAAYVVLSNLRISDSQITSSVYNFTPAYGRGEIVNYKNLKFKIFLAKNPESFNGNLKIISKELSLVNVNLVFIIFNSEIPDGKDVSWIYDIETKLLEETLSNKKIILSGERVFDMLVRLKYANLEKNVVFYNSDVSKCLKFISDNYSSSNEIIVFPNYSAMLNFRKLIIGKKIL